MSTKLAMNNTKGRKHHKQRLTPNGTLFEFLASPDETGSGICLIRGTIPPGAAVPLHSHPDVELFYVLEGSIEAFHRQHSRMDQLQRGKCRDGNGKHQTRIA